MSHAFTAQAGRRALSTSCTRLALAQRSTQKSTPRTKPSAKSAKPAPKAFSRSSPKASPKSSKSSKPSTKPAPKTTSPPAVQAKPRPSKSRAPLPLATSDNIRALSFLPPLPAVSKTSETPAQVDDVAALAAAVRLGPTPTTAALDRASSLFVRPEPQFLYSAPRFLNLPVNTRIPEICILGRSNVGKSTLLNALAGLESGGKAGHSHGARPSRFGLAITSARAGCTKMMNGYGFGPPLKAAQQQVFERVLELEEDKNIASKVVSAYSSSSGSSTVGLSRSQKRAQKPGEPIPAHSLVLIDMPGYGFMSKSEWGAEITKYLERRATLRGAILLVDAVAGLKDGDRHALAMLRNANVRTTIILTKADKLLPAWLLRVPAAVAEAKREERAAVAKKTLAVASVSPEPAFHTGSSEGEQSLRTSCLRIWKTLRRIERASFGTVPWMEGQGWSPEIVVTGAGDPKGGGFGVAGARLAICRMAGLLSQHTAVEETSSASVKKQKKAAVARGETAEDIVPSPASSTVVPFDQIQWSEKVTEAKIDQSAELLYIEQQEAARQERKARIQQKIVSQADEKKSNASSLVEEDPSSPEALAVEPKTPSSRGRRRPWKR